MHPRGTGTAGDPASLQAGHRLGAGPRQRAVRLLRARGEPRRQRRHEGGHLPPRLEQPRRLGAALHAHDGAGARGLDGRHPGMPPTRLDHDREGRKQ